MTLLNHSTGGFLSKARIPSTLLNHPTGGFGDHSLGSFRFTFPTAASVFFPVHRRPPPGGPSGSGAFSSAGGGVSRFLIFWEREAPGSRRVFFLLLRVSCFFVVENTHQTKGTKSRKTKRKQQDEASSFCLGTLVQDSVHGDRRLHFLVILRSHLRGFLGKSLSRPRVLSKSHGK